ncbi:unnamed protein product [Echinostoma caproni]|uniref:Virion structural protein n=1 Tax=Echinostoma caproni TaxID=27848 RepID=A0A183B6W0_9TREM|nr:unnamed protein product [Echinostoma caproni]
MYLRDAVVSSTVRADIVTGGRVKVTPDSGTQAPRATPVSGPQTPRVVGGKKDSSAIGRARYWANYINTKSK